MCDFWTFRKFFVLIFFDGMRLGWESGLKAFVERKMRLSVDVYMDNLNIMGNGLF